MDIPVYYTLLQCEPVRVQDCIMPYMKSLHLCLNRIRGEGYAEVFNRSINGIQCLRTFRTYQPEEFIIVNVFRFEGNSNPHDNVKLHIIETSDGLKGTLALSYNEVL